MWRIISVKMPENVTGEENFIGGMKDEQSRFSFYDRCKK